MKHRMLIVFASLLALVTLGATSRFRLNAHQPSPKTQERIVKEVRHELLMLPYFGVFDYIAFKVDEATTSPCSRIGRKADRPKSDAESAVKHI